MRINHEETKGAKIDQKNLRALRFFVVDTSWGSLRTHLRIIYKPLTPSLWARSYADSVMMINLHKGDDMCALAFVRRKAQASIKPRLTARRALDRAQVVGAAAGLFGGVAAGVFGSVFMAASWFVTNEGARHWLSTTGTMLLFLTIPLLIIGGYCLDWLEKDKPQRGSKVARYEDDDDEK